MNRIKYAEQLYALISMCLGCAFIVFGLLSFIGILQPTSTSIVQSQRNIGIVFSVLGVAFLIAQAIFTALASAKKKSYYELISNGIKVNGIVEKVYMQKFLQYGKKSRTEFFTAIHTEGRFIITKAISYGISRI